MWTHHTKVVGPLIALSGGLLCLVGLLLWFLGWKLNQEERERIYLARGRRQSKGYMPSLSDKEHKSEVGQRQSKDFDM